MVTTKEERHERNSVAAGVAGRFTARIAISDDQVHSLLNMWQLLVCANLVMIFLGRLLTFTLLGTG